MIVKKARIIAAIGAVLSLWVPSPAHPAPIVTGSEKMDRQLATIATAVTENRADVLMSKALSKELYLRNSPFEARWNAAGQVQVYLRYYPYAGEPELNAIQALGADDIVVSRQLGIIQAWIPAGNLSAATQIGGVVRVTIPRYARLKRINPLGTRKFAGSVDTQGDGILGASQFRLITGLNGKGSTVGVISDGDTNASQAAASGDLPSKIWNDPKNSGTFKSSGDEGTAMLEIVYDLAPGVDQLGFCGPGTDVDFLTCLNDFAANIKPTVIVDDLGFPGEAMFTDGSFAQGVQTFSNSNPSIRLVTAAGNDGNGFWSGQWNSTAAPPVTTNFTLNGITYTQALNFGTAASHNPDISFQVQGKSAVPKTGDTGVYIVQWNDPWSDTAATNINDDYDVVLFDSSNHIIAYNQGTSICAPPVPASPANNIYCTVQTPPSGLTASQSSPGPQPVQGSSWTNTANTAATVHMEVFLSPQSQNTPGNNIKILAFSQNAFPVFLTPSTPGGIIGQAALDSEITVGAVPSSNGVCDFITPTTKPEPYSSQGPVVLGTTSAQTVETRMKPDFAAPDGVNTTGAGGFPEPFCGTSAAAPHIAGLIALLGPAYPNRVTYNLLSKYAAAPDASAVPNGLFGNGLPSLTAMLNAGDFPPPVAVISAPTANISVSTGASTAFNGSCNANGASSVPTLDWNFGNGSGIADSNSANPSVTFSKAGTYTVTLTCTSSLGSGAASVNVTATAPSSGGGGGLEWLELIGLLSALAWRRRDRAMPAGFSVPAR